MYWKYQINIYFPLSKDMLPPLFDEKLASEWYNMDVHVVHWNFVKGEALEKLSNERSQTLAHSNGLYSQLIDADVSWVKLTMSFKLLTLHDGSFLNTL